MTPPPITMLIPEHFLLESKHGTKWTDDTIAYKVPRGPWAPTILSIFIFGVLLLTVACAATPAAPATPAVCSASAQAQGDGTETRARFTIDDTEIIVQLADNPTSRDFVTMLPLSLEFEEFAGNEKISYLPRELEIEGSPGHQPVTGDLIYYVPWGNLGFFYEDGNSYSDDVILIGTIESGQDNINDLEAGPVCAQLTP